MSTESISAWWWRPAPNATNFGDELGPTILTRHGHDLVWSPLREAELIVGGSVLQIVHRMGQQLRPNVKVWGSGLIEEQSPRVSPNVDHVMVRGQLTRSRLRLPQVTPLGDPGILAPLVWGALPASTGTLFVRHMVDSRPKPSWADAEASCLQPVDEMMEAIRKASTVVTSSLHGFIVAQSYDIPAYHWQHPKVIGGPFKFLDYMTGVAAPNLMLELLA